MPPRSKADPRKLAAAVRVVLDGALSQRAACKRYGVPKTTLSRAVAKAREEADRTGPDQGVEDGPDRTGPNQTPEEFPEVHTCAPDDRLSARKWRAAMLLVAANQTTDEIAAVVGVSRRTLFNWKSDPVFASVLDELRAAARVQAVETVARAGEEAAHLARRTNRALDRLLRHAEAVLDRVEAGEDVPASEVKEARGMVLALADKVPKGAVPMLDRGGFPKTERVEVTTDRPDEAASPLDRGKSTRARLKVLQGGAT